MNRLLRWLGVSASDMPEAARYRGPGQYAISMAGRSLLRLLANHCIIPSLRCALFRLSGVTIGARVRLNMNLTILDDYRPGLVSLGDEVSVAPMVSIVASAHANDSLITRKYGITAVGPIRVKTGAWLGAGCVLLPGVTIGRCGIVGANAVVTKDVPDFAIVAGVPAACIGDVRTWKTKTAGSSNPSDTTCC